MSAVLAHRARDAWIDPYPEKAIHHSIGVGEIPDYPTRDLLMGGLFGEIPAEEHAGGDASLLKVADHLGAREGRGVPDKYGEAEPARLGVSCFLGQEDVMLISAELTAKVCEVFPPRPDEPAELGELGTADGSLHIGDLEIVSDVGVDVLVVVAEGERAEFLGEPLAAGIVMAGLAPAVPSPVPE